VAIRSDVPKPDISTTAAFKQAMLNAKSISYTKGSTAGAYLASVMKRLGIADEMKQKTKLMGGAGQNPKAVAAGEVEFGLSLISDILAVPQVQVLGPLPPELQKYVVETAGISGATKDRAAADALLVYLKGPTSMAIFKLNGFESVTQ
jgi:molybdate transport system substrate-binding protein